MKDFVQNTPAVTS